jgi:hypothetical protein
MVAVTEDPPMTEAQIDPRARNAVPLSELAAWAWRETPPVHRNAGNLLIHVVAVPMFVVGHALLVAAIGGGPRWLAAGGSCIVLSVALQRVGHGMEAQAVHPFAGPRDFARRLYVEQFYNFWRFLLSGGWLASLKASRS